VKKSLADFNMDAMKARLTAAFGDWREGVTHKIEPPEAFRLSDEERDAYKKERDKKQRARAKEKNDRQRAAALRAQKWWSKLSDAPVGDVADNYLMRKQIQGYGVKYSPKGAVVVPLIDMGGTIHGLQFIHKAPRIKDGDEIGKDFAPWGMNPKGHFHLIGVIPQDNNQSAASRRVKLGICEGYATGASLHEATGIPIFVAFNAGNLLPVSRVVREAYPDAEIYIFADDDYLTKKPVENPGVTEGRKVAKVVKGQVVVPLFPNRNGEKWTDFNDLHVQESLDVVHDQVMQSLYGQPDQKQTRQRPVIEIAPGNEWQWKFSRTQTGKPRAEINNIKLVLMNDERWRGVLQYNEFDCDIHKLKLPPFEDNPKLGDWDEVDTERLRCWLGEYYEFTPSEKDAIAAIRVVAENFGVHPIKDYLESREWDKTERLDTWMIDFLGAEDNEYTRKASSKFLIGAAARVYARKGAGVKMDNVLILEGLQGEGKSTTIEALASAAWFSETPFELGSKDGYQQLRGVWFQELAELDAFNKSETNRAKAFFSTKEDYYRPSYGRKAAKFPRQCVFVGSTNQEHYLKDVTGNRRYWPVKCTELNIDALREARDQLWAEAYHRYKNKESWWVSKAEKALFEYQQEERLVEDTWESDILFWLNDPDQRNINLFTQATIMRNALAMTPKDMTPPNQTRVGMIMMRIKWAKVRRRIDKLDDKGEIKKKPAWFYERPEDECVTPIVKEDDDWGVDLPR